MTHDVLQSDIELARRLIKEEKTDPEIISALGFRGIPEGTATQLIEDLRAGRLKDQPMTYVPRSPKRTAVMAGEGAQPHPPRKHSSKRRPQKPGQGNSVFFWILVALLALLAIGAVGYAFYEFSNSMRDAGSHTAQ